MSNNEIVKILYNEEIGETVRELINELCSPNLKNNDDILAELRILIKDNIAGHGLWSTFVTWLYNSIPDFLTHFTEVDADIVLDEKIKNITIPKNIKKINTGAFAGSKGLLTVNFEKDSELEFLNHSAFFGCKNLKVLDLSNTLITEFDSQTTSPNDSAIVYLPNTITTLHDGSLASFTDVMFPNVNSISDLKLNISKNALNDWNGWMNQITIETKTDKDVITKEDEDAIPVLGPILLKNKNIKIYK